MSFGRKERKNEPKIWRVPTMQSMANAALAYVERYAASEASFRRVLENKIRRAAMHNPAFAEDRAAQAALREGIDSLVHKYRQNGVLNDAAFAAMKAGNLRRGGTSARRISQKLMEKGIKNNLIAKALEVVDEEGTTEEQAARLFAKKKGLGPYRRERAKKVEDAVLQKREVAAFLRAGFSYGLVKSVLGAEVEAGMDEME